MNEFQKTDEKKKKVSFLENLKFIPKTMYLQIQNNEEEAKQTNYKHLGLVISSLVILFYTGIRQYLFINNNFSYSLKLCDFCKLEEPLCR
jgi:hypothetical protein